jgi:hypothetical protein
LMYSTNDDRPPLNLKLTSFSMRWSIRSIERPWLRKASSRSREAIILAVNVAVATYLHPAPFGEGVDHRHPDPVKAAGDFVRFMVEFTAGVKSGHDHLEGRFLFVGMFLGGDAAAVVGDGYGIILVQFDNYVITKTGHGFVHGVIHHLVDHMVQTALAGVADIHRRPAAYRLESLEHVNIVGVVGTVTITVSTGFLACFLFRLFHFRSHLFSVSFLTAYQPDLPDSTAVRVTSYFR